MSKGISSHNSLKALAHPIQRFLSAWGAQRPSRAVSDGSALPAPYELAALRGEGVLRNRFFNELVAKIPVTLGDAEQVQLWHDLVEDGGYITAWVQRLGINKAIRREVAAPESLAAESRKLYTLLLDALSQQAPELLPWAVEAYFWHVWKSRFPAAPTNSTATPKSDTTSADALRDKLLRRLRKRYAEPVELKESFEQTEQLVQFALLVKRQSVGKWEELVRLERPRLKTARLAAYGQAYKQAAEDSL